jgi:hypothetical protein
MDEQEVGWRNAWLVLMRILAWKLGSNKYEI